MNKKTPLRLSFIELWAYDSESDAIKEYPAKDLFDMRRDFELSPTQSGLAIKLTFIHPCAELPDGPRGVRRSIDIRVEDMTSERLMGRTKAQVYIPHNRSTGTVRADVSLPYEDIHTRHTYRVTVSETSTGTELGTAEFHFFDPKVYGRDPQQWYTPITAALIPDSNTDKSYISYDTKATEGVDIHFIVCSHFEEEPVPVPEMEIRIFRPDGKVKNYFCRPEFDDLALKIHSVRMHLPAEACSYGLCYAELLCMEYPVAGFVFSTCGPNKEGECDSEVLECLEEYTPQAYAKRLNTYFNGPDDDELEQRLAAFISSEKESLGQEEEETGEEKETENEEEEEEEEDFMKPLEELTGLESVKRKLTAYEKLTQFNRMRRLHRLTVTSTPLHAMFLGSPGTGKTTVAKVMGKMLVQAGMLSKGHVVMKERGNLIGRFYGMEEEKTREAIKEAQGGILFIDEAYQLYQPEDPKDPGRLVIETLMTALADEEQRDWMLILAGYPEETRRMFDMNPGLKSRIPESNIYEFRDFTEPELMEIAERYLNRNEYTLSPMAREALALRFQADYRMRDKNFGNARHVVNMIQNDILPAMAQRVMESGEISPDSLSEIQVCDIPQPVQVIRKERRHIGFCA